MFAPPRKKMDPKDFEQVKVNDLLPSTIVSIEYEDNHQFPGFQGAPGTVEKGVRIKFSIDGYKHPKNSGWLKFSYGSKTNLYKKYLSSLVEGMSPDATFDLDHLVGMRIKTMWKQNGTWQNLSLVVPFDKPIPYTPDPAPGQPYVPVLKEGVPEEKLEEAPF